MEYEHRVYSNYNLACPSRMVKAESNQNPTESAPSAMRRQEPQVNPNESFFEHPIRSIVHTRTRAPNRPPAPSSGSVLRLRSMHTRTHTHTHTHAHANPFQPQPRLIYHAGAGPRAIALIASGSISPSASRRCISFPKLFSIPPHASTSSFVDTTHGPCFVPSNSTSAPSSFSAYATK